MTTPQPAQRDPAILGLIGNTPLVEITRLDTGPCRLFVKLESQNPGGSIKDRIALSMIDAAEHEARCARRHHRRGDRRQYRPRPRAGRASRRAIASCSSFPTRCRAEKVLHLRALGAEVRMTRSDVGKGHPEYYQDMAERIAAETRRLLRQPVRQSGQSGGARAHDRAGDLGADGARRRRGRRAASARAAR